MKAAITSGICLVVALVLPRLSAQEIQWRPAAPKSAAASAAPATSVTPVAYSIADAPPATAIGLGRPIASAGPLERLDTADARNPRSADQATPLVRGQAPELTAQPLPVGFPLKQEGTKDGKGATPQTLKPPTQVEPGFVPPIPKMMNNEPIGEPYGYTGPSPAIVDGGGLMSLGDCGSGCFNDCCDCSGCDACCPYRGRRFYASAEYLGWTFQRKNIPPLVTASPVGTPAGTTGVLGLPTTVVLVDDNSHENFYHSGGRFNVGFWLPRDNWGLEVDYLFLGQQTGGTVFGSAGDPQFSRPVIIGGRETVQFVSLPNVVTGSVGVNMSSQMWGLEFNARQKLLCGPRGWVDMLYGYRHLDLSESINIGENLVQLNPAGNLGIGILDQFHTRNVFNGGQIGIQGEWHFLRHWFVGGTFKLGLGDVHEQVNIAGSIAYTPLPNGQTTTFNSGILAAGTNIGNHQSNHFAVMPELNFKLGYELNEHWRIWAGYDFLFVSNVVRPGDQIDRRINPSQIPLPPPAGAQPLVGVAQPAVLFRTTTFIAQGVSFGLQYRW